MGEPIKAVQDVHEAQNQATAILSNLVGKEMLYVCSTQHNHQQCSVQAKSEDGSSDFVINMTRFNGYWFPATAVVISDPERNPGRAEGLAMTFQYGAFDGEYLGLLDPEPLNGRDPFDLHPVIVCPQKAAELMPCSM